MGMARIPWLAIFIFAWLVLTAIPAAAVGLTNVPLHDPAYDDLQKLLALTGHRVNLATLPVSRLEMAQILRDIRAGEDFQAMRRRDRLAAALYDRLASRFVKEIQYLDANKNRGRFDVRFSPLQRAGIDVGYARTQSRFLQEFPFAQPVEDSPRGVRSTDEFFQRPSPMPAYAAATGQVFLEGALELEDHFALFVRPNLEFVADFDDFAADESEQEGDLDIGYAKLQWFNVALEVGRDSFWWGPGHFGTLLLSDNAPPLDSLKLQSHQPFRIPWLFKYLGPMTLTTFLAQLEEDRYVPNPYLLGFRYTLMPLDRLEIGVARTIQFGGEGGNKPGLENIDDILIGRSEHIYGRQGDTNQIALFDFRLTVPETRHLWKHFRQLQVWWEYGTETADWNAVSGVRVPSLAMPANVWGARLDFGAVDVLGEWADTHARGRWYTHYVYRDGYTHEKKVLGHPYGFGTQSFDGRIRWYATPNLQASLLPAIHRWRDRPLKREQRDYGGGTEIEWIFHLDWRMRLGGRFWVQEKIGNRPEQFAQRIGTGGELWLHSSIGF